MTTDDLYFNHAGTSWPKPLVVQKAVQDAINASPADWPARFEEAHEGIANFFGVDRREQILLTPGCTSALAIGIGDAMLASGQRVLTSRWEHHALHRPIMKLGSRGVPIDYIPSQREPQGHDSCSIDLDWLEQTLSKRDVGLIAITAACNVTGHLLPYEEVIRMAHQHGSSIMLDAAQVVGWQNIDLPSLDADMVAFGGHKGLQGPWGIGGLYLSDRPKMECIAATCQLPDDANADQVGSDRRRGPRPGYCDVGSVDQLALAGLFAATMQLRTQDTDAVLSRARHQISRVREVLEQFREVSLYGPSDARQGMPTLAFAIAGLTSNQVAQRFKNCGVIVGSGFQCAPLAHESLGTQELGLVRLSVGVGQPDQEIEDAIDRIRSALGLDQ